LFVLFQDDPKRTGFNDNNGKSHRSSHANTARKYLNSESSLNEDASYKSSDSSISNNDMANQEMRKPLKLLPRTLPIDSSTTVHHHPSSQSHATANTLPQQTTTSSIFGAGKPRDINNPEIRKLEERLEKTLAITYTMPMSTSPSNINAVK
jgi:hypothetical protein